ncbi:unnamed protein product, partial [Candidula unifasciata]
WWLRMEMKGSNGGFEEGKNIQSKLSCKRRRTAKTIFKKIYSRRIARTRQRLWWIYPNMV